MNQHDIAIQMDTIESITITTDSTFALALEAQRRGHRLFYYTVDNLCLDQGVVKATMFPLKLYEKQGQHYALGEPCLVDLSSMHVLLIRQDPPFDMRYITSTYLLERVAKSTHIINNPTEIRNCPEKLLVTNFSDLTPPTIITESLELIRGFHQQYQDIIIKPLYGCGGMDVFRITKEALNLTAIVDALLRLHQSPLVVQCFLPSIAQGDKRVLLIEGEPVGAVSRMPERGEVRANFHAGGSAQKTPLTDRDYEICQRIAPILQEKGLFFVGIDIIGEYITEINVTSPTGIHEINRLNQTNIEAIFWDKFV